MMTRRTEPSDVEIVFSGVAKTVMGLDNSTRSTFLAGEWSMKSATRNRVVDGDIRTSDFATAFDVFRAPFPHGYCVPFATFFGVP